jgi:hypothetical protein
MGEQSLYRFGAPSVVSRDVEALNARGIGLFHSLSRAHTRARDLGHLARGMGTWVLTERLASVCHLQELPCSGGQVGTSDAT